VDRARAAGDVDDPARRAGAQLRQERLRDAPCTEEIGLERLVDLVEVGVGRPLPGVVEDRGVVDEDVEVLDAGCGGTDALVVGDIEDDRADVRRAELARGARPAPTVARAEQDGESEAAELTADLEADAAVGAGDERDGGPVSRRGGSPSRRSGAR
jgi:hypothetical protein